jgi:hypothetical protein
VAVKALRLALFGLACAAGCSKKPAPPHRTEPWLAHPSASNDVAEVEAPLGFHFTAESLIRFTLSGKKGEISGRLPLDLGNSALRLDPRDLKRSRASLEVDLTKLSIDAEALPEGVEGGTPSALALQWLELGPAVALEKQRAFAVARFELSISPGSVSSGVGKRGRSSWPSLISTSQRSAISSVLATAPGMSEKESAISSELFK